MRERYLRASLRAENLPSFDWCELRGRRSSIWSVAHGMALGTRKLPDQELTAPDDLLHSILAHLARHPTAALQHEGRFDSPFTDGSMRDELARGMRRHQL
jgi:hypothetical protein